MAGSKSEDQNLEGQQDPIPATVQDGIRAPAVTASGSLTREEDPLPQVPEENAEVLDEEQAEPPHGYSCSVAANHEPTFGFWVPRPNSSQTAEERYACQPVVWPFPTTRSTDIAALYLHVCAVLNQHLLVSTGSRGTPGSLSTGHCI